jgi:signal transduction histidine kinase
MLAGWLLAATFACAWLLGRRRAVVRAEALRRACHELRGPLTAIGLGIQLLARDAAATGPRVRAIELELGRAALALDDLAGAWNGSTGSARDVLRPVEMRALLADSVEAWRAAAAPRELRLELPHATQVWVVGSRVRLAQVTGNLIANAIEHGRGEIVVRVQVAPGSMRVEVVDSGPGLPAAVAQLARGGSRRGRTMRGRGLAIAASVVASHGGRLFSAPASTGARVVLELPLAWEHGHADAAAGIRG